MKKAGMPKLSDAAPEPLPPVRVTPLRAEAFDEQALTDIYIAGCVFAAAIGDISHDHIGDPWSWDLYGTGPDELARLHAALDQMADAIREARSRLAQVERRVRRTMCRGDR
jgi:hypothetical protein